MYAVSTAFPVGVMANIESNDCWWRPSFQIRGISTSVTGAGIFPSHLSDSVLGLLVTSRIDERSAYVGAF